MRFFVLVLFPLSLFITTSFAFDYYQLVLQWPPSYCYGQQWCARPDLKNFTIHGLWPTNFTRRGLWLSNFTEIQATNRRRPFPLPIEPLMGELRHQWPDLYGKDEVFWIREWWAHGAGFRFDPFRYFRIALYLKKREDLLGNLVKAHITPSSEKLYSAESIFRAILRSTGKPRLHCSGNVLLEISICVKLSLRKFPCPRTPATWLYWNSCPPNVIFPL